MSPREELEAAWAAVLQGDAPEAELVRDGVARVEDARQMLLDEILESTSPLVSGFPRRALAATERLEEALGVLERRVQHTIKAKQRIRALLRQTQELLDKGRG